MITWSVDICRSQEKSRDNNDGGGVNCSVVRSTYSKTVDTLGDPKTRLGGQFNDTLANQYEPTEANGLAVEYKRDSECESQGEVHKNSNSMGDSLITKQRISCYKSGQGSCNKYSETMGKHK